MSHSQQTPSDYQRPFLKWAGNKFQLLEPILGLLPQGKRLIEPFVGSGVVFLNSQYDRYVLNDKNFILILLYKTLKKHGDQFINAAAEYYQARYNKKTTYYAMRDQFNTCEDDFERAVLFMYLNRHGYNGLCRFNKQGKYNVPFGQFVQPTLPVTTMHAFYQKSQRARLHSQDFTTVMRNATPGDVIYCDPPYVPLSNTAFFTSYWAGFDMACQEKLAEAAKACAQRGIPVLISNHDTPVTRKLYKNATRIERYEVQRHISCKVENRQKARELLALFS